MSRFAALEELFKGRHFDQEIVVLCVRRGAWMYLYRAVDKNGKTVDFYLSRRRDVNAAKAFLRKAMKGQRTPIKITLDAYAASHRAVADLKEDGELPKRVLLRSSKYLNNLIEQDHRRIKQRLRPMLGLKSFCGHRWHRISRQAQKAAIQNRPTRRQQGHYA
jgi:hypothetical protein